MKYEFTGKDLPELYKGCEDPTFHEGESWELAVGDGWVARVASCGELSMSLNGEWADTKDIIAIYDTDEKLSEAVKQGIVDYRLNNWYEVEFFAVCKDGLQYLDLMSDDCVCYSFDEALHIFNDYMSDKSFCEDLKKYVKEYQK